jgi:hypothetical protein
LSTPIIPDAKGSLVASFAAEIASDKSAVRAAVKEPWSNVQAEVQISKLKLVKRQMYGSANLDLLQARLVTAAQNPEASSRLRQPLLPAILQLEAPIDQMIDPAA